MQKEKCECGNNIGRNGKLCRVCYEAEKYQERQQKVIILCKRCGGKMSVSISHRATYMKAGGGTCRKCRSEISSEVMIQTRSKETKEERITRGKHGSALADHRKGVLKQWETIRANPEAYKLACKSRSDKLKAVWDGYGDEARSKRIKLFYESFGKRRSRVSDALKQSMVDAGLYEGFVSEEVFHGFIPDEINHNLKLVVEMFGDLYHCNPKRYTDASVFISTIGRTVGEQWSRDKRRFACFHKYGYRTVVVWDSDFRNDPKREIERIKLAIERQRLS